MIQIPKVIQLHKDGRDTTKVLFKNILFISSFSSIIVIPNSLNTTFIIKKRDFGQLKYLT
jgi:hypothetical protein